MDRGNSGFSLKLILENTSLSVFSIDVSESKFNVRLSFSIFFSLASSGLLISFSFQSGRERADVQREPFCVMDRSSFQC